MSDLCLIYASEDRVIARQMVAILRQYWSVWWDGDINHGPWDDQVMAAVTEATGIVALLTKTSANKPIFKSEARRAHGLGKPLFPFALEPAEMPLGLDAHNRTDAFGWAGEMPSPALTELLAKIRRELSGRSIQRKTVIALPGKEIRLPAFVCSASSFETQVSPEGAVQLFALLQRPRNVLVSAYDAWAMQRKRSFLSNISRIRKSGCVLFLDSGNYEADRLRDQKTKTNPEGWQRSKFIEIATILKPDIAFGFDDTAPKGGVTEVAGRIVSSAIRERRELGAAFPTIPIVHLPRAKDHRCRWEHAPELIRSVAEALDPLMVAVPERELGDGIAQRVETVRAIRRTLNATGRYIPLHLLGTGNPLSITALAAAGADSFDGLEWCRTVADWRTGFLYHFQHLDFFLPLYRDRVDLLVRRSILENDQASYAAKTACLNIEFFNDWMDELHAMIHSGQVTRLMQRVLPGAGSRLHEKLEDE
ncbi:MAG: toll/interleukin-1 receptor domain-containing protein [Sulfuritalea sp.]|nr:toll/interleukin-1 receptor domain-containing protein [Sulfuritalea sp.]MDP1981570.1 toll/interleukin-1 receptor domain-containing protein [Sulfuritalea sp.]